MNLTDAGPLAGMGNNNDPDQTGLARSRVLELLTRAKSETLTMAEASEMEHYLQLEHLMRLAKARARQCLSDSRET